MDVKELETQIMYYASKYYEGEPEISDEQFDMLVDRLRILNPNSSVLKTGWGFEVKADKVKHKYSHIGSLDKVKSYEEIPDRFKDRTIFISPKLDGLSAVAYFENGQLVKGITRGNGEYGKDITDKLRLILGKSIGDNKFTGAVRGELIISDANWDKLQTKYNNLIAPRNFAAGIINRKEIDEDIKYVDLVVYKVVGQENKDNIFNTREEMLQWLRLNFEKAIPLYYYPVLNFSSWETYHQQTFDDFRKIGYGLDGLVLDSPNVIYDTTTNGYIFDEVAFKFQAESTTTIVKEIQWELSRTQRLIPVAVVEPVELSGAIVERATCNNAKWVKEMELGAEAEVEICRSNEVIPQILSVLQPSNESLPIRCPVCDDLLVWDGVDLKCANAECPNRKMSDLQQWCENVGETDGLQWTLMKQYLDFYKITNIDELYSKQVFVLNDLNSKKLSITELKIKEFFEKLYLNKIPIEKALIGLNIPRLGEKTAKLLATRRDIVFNLLLISLGQLGVEDDWTKYSLLELVKDATTSSIYENIEKFEALRYTYTNVNVPMNYSANTDNGKYMDDITSGKADTRLVYTESNNAEKQYIAVTGALNTMKRKDFEAYIEKFNYELSSNLKKCKYLVTNTPDSGSSKNKDAQKYGVEIITEQDFLNLLN